MTNQGKDRPVHRLNKPFDLPAADILPEEINGKNEM
jgi:hypothetical protein